MAESKLKEPLRLFSEWYFATEEGRREDAAEAARQLRELGYKVGRMRKAETAKVRA